MRRDSGAPSRTTRAIAVHPGRAGSLHAREVPRPRLTAVPGGRGVRVRLSRVGLCGTDREIVAGEFGRAPAGARYLILGHESLGEVVEAGQNAPPSLQPGTLVVATVRRAGTSPYDRLGMVDFTTDPPIECGINQRHGFLTEELVEDPEYLVAVPASLARVGVLLEPLSIVEKGVQGAMEVQRRLRIWRPARAAVTGAGTIGLLAALVLRLSGSDVTVLSRRARGFRNSRLVEALDARYLSTSTTDLAAASRKHGPFDLVFEASGFSPLAFEAARAVGTNGVVVLCSVTSGSHQAEVDTDAINQDLVLGNRTMLGTVNASRDDFVRGVGDLLRAEAFYPGWLDQLLTTPVNGLDDARAIQAALDDEDAIKAYVEVGRG